MSGAPRQIIDEVEDAVAAGDLERLDHMSKTYFKAADVGPRPFSAAVKLTKEGQARVAPEARESMSPVEESALALDLANAVERGRRLIRYRRKVRAEPAAPRIVAEGDSWFQYPFRLADIVDVLMEKYAVNCLSAGGDTVENMVRSGEYLDAIAAEKPAAFIFSGGGNDLVGDGKLRTILRRFRPEAEPAELINDAAFNSVLRAVTDGFAAILRNCARRFPGLKVLSHGYDHPHNIEKGPWIWPYMEEKGIPLETARKIIAILLDRFNGKLADLARAHANFVHVPLVGSVGDNPGSWYDALHPRDPGFRRAGERFVAAIDKLLEASPQREGVTASRESIGDPRLRPRRSTGSGKPAGMRASEAIRASFTMPNGDYPIWEDFPPESQWIDFDDPDVHKHIKDVISLLQRRHEPEVPELVDNRVGLVAGAEARTAGFPEALDASALAEAIIGGNDLEPIQTLLRGYRASKATGLISRTLSFGGREPRGTGFLVGPGLLLTNHHVLPSPEFAARCVLTMDDEMSLVGDRPNLQRFRITPDLYYASKALDFAFVSVERHNAERTALADYGILELIASSGKAIKGEPVSIIQHAGGESKTIALRNSFVMGRVEEGIYYTADTKPGSSGACVMSRDWQIVALHHRTVPHPTIRDQHLANRGVRISAILDHIAKEATKGVAGAVRVRALIGNLGAGEAAVVSTGSGSEHAQTLAPASDDRADSAIDGVYSGLTTAELLVAIGRTGEANDHAIAGPVAEALPSDRDSVERRVGEKGMRFIIGHEVSSPAEYRRRFKSPILPGGQSGITIGIGYDLGYHTAAELNAHWQGLLPAQTLARLARCIGKTQSAARPLLAQVRDIEIPYESALEVFKRSTLPKYFMLLDNHIDDAQLSRLPPDCVAALVSLTFNRGASYDKAGDRYREMREIKASLNAGRFNRVPGLLRSMKRLWANDPNVRGLLRRRDEEAALFESGLAALQSGPHEALAGAPNIADIEELPDSETLLYSKIDGDEDSELDRKLPRLQEALETAVDRRRLTLAEVGWVHTYSNNPDYWHLPSEAEGATFTVTADLIDHLIAAGRYQPHFTSDGDLIVGVRGAAIHTGEEVLIEKAAVRLKEQKPDHRTFRCTMLVYNKVRRVLSAFKASTVPNRGGVVSQYNKHAGFGGVNANMLPTGCYELCVGTHNGSVTVPTVLRLGTGPTSADALRVTTLRTLNDGVFGTADFWDNCIPMDNIHPAFSASSAEFSSLGCLTIPGRFSGGRHQGNWAKFREIARFNSDARRGTRYNLVLTTGMELAALAARSDHTPLARLSHGSRGPEVAALQRVLRAGNGGVFDAATKKALTQLEAARLDGNASGIYSARSERELGLGVFSGAV